MMIGKEKVMGRRAPSGTKLKKRTGSRKHSRVLDQINHNAAGVDAGAEFHYVAVGEERATPATRKFATTTRGLYELADWLAEVGVDTVAVEATGVYCVPLLEVLDERGFEVVLAKPSSLKSVNDRQKSDMMDCQWVQLLHTFGLLRGSFVPSAIVATYRTYNRQRQMLIEQAATAIEHMKKALTSMNVRVELAVSDITGKTGMNIIRAILAGERDPEVLARLRDDRCANSEAAIAEALFGKYADEHLFELDQAVRTWDYYQTLIAECSTRLEQHASTMFAKMADRREMPAARRVEPVRKNVLPFDARSLFFEVFGQDLTQIDGISVGTISVLLAEVGPNLDAFATFKNFGSWLRLCPGKNTTGGKNRSGRNRPTTNRLSTALRLAAQSLSRSQSALGAFYRRKRGHLGPRKAINATAYKLARMIFFTLKNQRAYVDPGPDHYIQQNRDRILKNMQRRAKQLGYALVEAA
jgi:transposase